jgi:ParB family chromosome partitioning protein
MSKRQSDYLNSLLAPAPASVEDEADAVVVTAPPRRAPPEQPDSARSDSLTLLGRQSALARIATGEVKQVTQLLLDPSRVRVWSGNARHQASLSEASCRDLIDAILAEGGQKVPAIVRRVQDDPSYDYEVIAGTRRLFAISWLRANNYADMMFVAQVHVLDDESAFRLSDIENRARKDVSEFERACSYKEALEAHYGGRQIRMAERLRLSKGWLSKMITVAGLPDWAVRAFASPADIQLKSAYPLAVRASSSAQGDARIRKAMMAAAAELAAEQQRRRRLGLEPVSASDVVHGLLTAGVSRDEKEVLFSADSAHGRKALSVLSSNRNGVTLRLHAGSGASEPEILKLVKDALTSLERRGEGLRLKG